MPSISERARERASAAASEREDVKRPSGGAGTTNSASRWELLTELERAYGLIADLAEKVERLESEGNR